MSKLSVKEKDLLQRVHASPELRTLFFRKVKGVKWFDALNAAGYFEARNIPEPRASKQEGFVTILKWDICDYLLKTVQELDETTGPDYYPRFLKIIVDATNYAKGNGFGNYQTWWLFSEIISHIPHEFISVEFLDSVDYWLSDNIETGLVVKEIGEKWLLKLLNEQGEHELTLAMKLLEILYEVRVEESVKGEGKHEVFLRFGHHNAEKITQKIAFLSGEKLEEKAVLLFQHNFEMILAALGNDLWSSSWQPAIEDHSQNRTRGRPENVFVKAYRDSLRGYLSQDSVSGCDYIGEMLKSPYQTIRRIAIYTISQNFQACNKYLEKLISPSYLHSNFRHEMWHLFNLNYLGFDVEQKKTTLELIGSIVRFDEDEKLLVGATAYNQAIWFAAIQEKGSKELGLYKNAVAIAKAEPDHPDFSSYFSTTWGGQNSPYSIEDLAILSIDELVETLVTYKGSRGWKEPGIEGLVNAVQQLIKESPLYFYTNLSKFLGLDVAYTYSVIEAYRSLWNEKSQLPWDDIWNYLLKFCIEVINKEGFWSEKNSEKREDFVANRHWIVTSIGRLIEDGVKSDAHSIDEKYHDEIELLLGLLLKNQEGSEFEIDSDAMSISINSPRGHCIEALINFTLRSCRLADEKNNKNHIDAWEHFQHYYDDELKRPDQGEYEFATLVTSYLPNFSYMSNDWVFNNLDLIFDQTNHLKWLCSMQGYSHVGVVYKEIYDYLSKHGDLLLALDDEKISDSVKEKVVQNIVVAYINDFDEQELIHKLIQRNNVNELHNLIWFVGTFRKSKEDTTLKGKVYELWLELIGVINLSNKEGRMLASSLCRWAIFVDVLDEEKQKMLEEIAPYAHESHNTVDLLKSLSALSDKQPIEAGEVWMKIIQGSIPDYPKEAIHKILSNLSSQGAEGKRLARDIESKYLEKGARISSSLS